jgi:hypothetical protein
MSNLKSIRSDIHYKMVNHQPHDLTVTFEGTGSGSAVLLGKQIIVTLAAAESAKYVNISTPIGFRVINAHSIHQNATASTWQLANTTDAIGTAVVMAASDTDIDVAVDVDDAYNAFLRGDDDLRLIISVAAATAIIIIDIEPTIA